MFQTNDPDDIVAGLGIAFLLLAGLWRWISRVRESPPSPDPWDAEVQRRLDDPETREVCPHCSTPQEPGMWFCENCGRAVGPYNNLMPYVNVFSEGEVFRNGATGRFRNKPIILIGYCLISLGLCTSLAPAAGVFLAPLFCVFLLFRVRRSGESAGPGPASGDRVPDSQA